MVKPINVYSVPELRQALDEALAPTLQRLDYEEVHTLTDLKLALGYSMGIIATGSFLMDKKLSWDESLFYQKILLVVYCIISVIFWYFTKFMVKGVTYMGKNKKTNTTLKLKTSFKSNTEPIYNVTFETSDNKKSTVQLDVTKVFSEQGYLQSNLFLDWLKEQLNNITSKKDL